MSISSQVELKGLQTRLTTLDEEIKLAKQVSKEATEKVKQLESKRHSVFNQIQSLKNSSEEIVVSEHAILRYLEHVKGVNIEAIKKEMLPDKSVETINKLSSCKIHAEDHKLVVKNRTVVTVIPTGEA